MNRINSSTHLGNSHRGSWEGSSAWSASSHHGVTLLRNTPSAHSSTPNNVSIFLTELKVSSAAGVAGTALGQRVNVCVVFPRCYKSFCTGYLAMTLSTACPPHSTEAARSRTPQHCRTRASLSPSLNIHHHRAEHHSTLAHRAAVWHY